MANRTLRWLAVVTMAGGLCLTLACDRGDSSKSKAPAERDLVPPPAVRPEYTFTNADREAYPEIVAFLRHFLETCLAGDYAGYRELASRTREPESRERFEVVYHAIRVLRVESIEPVKMALLSDEVYLVTCDIELDPETKARLRRKTNKIAILVLKEQGEWRVLPAPSKLQPPPEEPQPTTAAAPTSAPSYPWDEDGDF